MDIVCLGELLVDLFPAELGRRLAEVSAFLPKPGGAPANVAVAAARLGAASAFVGKVGEDAFGQHLAGILAQQGVDISGMRFDGEARTTLAFIAKPDPNTSEYVFYRNPGADTRLQPDELDAGLLGHTQAFHFGSLSLSDEPVRSATWEAVRLAHAAGALVSFDVNYRPSLWRSPEEALAQITAMIPQVDLLKVNEVELALLAGDLGLEEGARSLLARGPSICVVTLGAQGSYFATGDGDGRAPAFQVVTVDATGCGDAFLSGLLCRLVLPVPDAPDIAGGWRARLGTAYLAASLRYANAVGALTATRQGVIPALPTAAQVEGFLAEQP